MTSLNDPALNLFDTHVHLDSNGDCHDLFAAARHAGVTRCLVAGTGLADSTRAAAVAAVEPGVFAAAGIHPHDAKAYREMGPFRDLCTQASVVAVGEIGLDYHYTHSPIEIQREVFSRFIQLGAELGLPAIIHCRDAYDDCMQILRNVLEPGQPFEIHSFTGTPGQAREMLAMGAYLSFNGMVTFRKADNIRAALAVVPLERLLLETDSPYLAPVPHRGRPNQPAYVVEIALAIAALRGLPVEELAAITTANACEFFRIR